ncbi:hypothetical protein NDU88_001574 [Pleurodeles waltl]|uniref:Uncharacterized protein n=1 Tax=Pleurodeles waltl TaxID=8319 RepID=A0AAV7TI77_PLEWA|nr:hypothetical protein NDU88_001574 [Pleurodeles waltl]
MSSSVYRVPPSPVRVIKQAGGPARSHRKGVHRTFSSRGDPAIKSPLPARSHTPSPYLLHSSTQCSFRARSAGTTVPLLQACSTLCLTNVLSSGPAWAGGSSLAALWLSHVVSGLGPLRTPGCCGALNRADRIALGGGRHKCHRSHQVQAPGPARLSMPPRQAELHSLLFTAVSAGAAASLLQSDPMSGPTSAQSSGPDWPSKPPRQAAICSLLSFPVRAADGQTSAAHTALFSASERVLSGSCHFGGWSIPSGIGLLGAATCRLRGSSCVPDHLRVPTVL